MTYRYQKYLPRNSEHQFPQGLLLVPGVPETEGWKTNPAERGLCLTAGTHWSNELPALPEGLCPGASPWPGSAVQCHQAAGTRLQKPFVRHLTQSMAPRCRQPGTTH